MIANGMRVMHFMDHRPFDVFHHQQHHYSSHYLPMTHYPPGYHPPVDGLTPEPYPPINSPASFSPHIIVPQPVLHNNSSSSNSSANSVGFQPYQSPHSQQCVDSNVIQMYVSKVTPLIAFGLNFWFCQNTGRVQTSVTQAVTSNMAVTTSRCHHVVFVVTSVAAFITELWFVKAARYL